MCISSSDDHSAPSRRPILSSEDAESPGTYRFDCFLAPFDLVMILDHLFNGLMSVILSSMPLMTRSLSGNELNDTSL